MTRRYLVRALLIAAFARACSPTGEAGASGDVLRRGRSIPRSALALVSWREASVQQAQPSFVLPAPTGPSLVGTTTLTVQGAPTRGSAAPRTLVVTAWYPTNDTTFHKRAPYLRELPALQQMAARGRNPAVGTLLHRDVVTHAWLDAPVARGRRPLPILIFSHGYLGMPSDYTALMEELASHGYAIFSVAHTGETMAVSLPDGRVESVTDATNSLSPLVDGVLGEWRVEDSVAAAVTSATHPADAEQTLRWYLQRIPKSTAALERWVTDTRLVVDEVLRLTGSRSGSPFAGRLDQHRIAALGHSMGGVTSAEYCARDRRCRCAVNLDGSPQYGDLIDHPSVRPFLMVYGSRRGRVGVSDPIYQKGAEYWRAVLDGALHLNFGDWQYWQGPARLSNGLGPIAPTRSTEIVHRLLREFLAANLDGSKASLFAGTRVYPELEVRRLPPR